jgi:thiol-disulfide isomerase/thioredoxin
LLFVATVNTVAAFAFAAAQEKASRDIYPAPEVAPAQIKAAISSAARSHKRVILDFGGNWCGDCRALDKYFQAEPNASLLKANFILVDVNIGQFDRNKELAVKYGVPLEKGVPALAVLDSAGQPLFSQKKGEFESMARMDPASVTEFLKHWKP